ncbi:hypothetical protein EAX62_03870 [Tessaracoccus antarcticus]|uniref:Uncharacterized protein n=2 Tax=Tessaracoccus antarcticus TaxID=2479848 RepID=A0A3M0GBM3_9ACTN|nr:hypothetical protein EAX62_03870 [Tessaracoccus antarcticus]
MLAALGCLTAVLGATSCAVSPILNVPGGDEMCASVLTDQAEPYWFGVPVSNPGQRAIALQAVRLGEQDHMVLNDSYAVPPVQQSDGTTLGVGGMRDPAKENPDLWAGRQPVDGYMLAPGTDVFLTLALSRDAAETGRVRSQVITYRVDGELSDRQATSRLRIILTEDCQTLNEDA